MGKRMRMGRRESEGKIRRVKEKVGEREEEKEDAMIQGTEIGFLLCMFDCI